MVESLEFNIIMSLTLFLLKFALYFSTENTEDNHFC